jgi:nitrogen fixation/metabolism regulation signal transduction histidine kinase
MNIKQFYVVVFFFCLSILLAIVAYVTDNQSMAEYIALFFVLDTVVFTILIVVYGAPKIKEAQKGRSKKKKLFRKVLQLFTVIMILFGLYSMFVMNVKIEKLFNSLDFFNLFKAFFFGSGFVATLYYSFSDLFVIQKK